jgi:hypothetical protein
MTTTNPILDELHATRERLLAESGGTLSGLIARLQAEQAASDRPQYRERLTSKALGAVDAGSESESR